MRVGLFGGTLDPVHLGHLRAAEEVREGLNLDEIWFMPAFQPPHKVAKPLTPFSHRFRMVQLATENVRHFRATDLEAQRPGPSYSVVTLRALNAARGKEASFFFIVGSDAFLEIHTWKEYSQLPRLSRLVIITRPPWSLKDIREAIRASFPDFQETEKGGLFTSGDGGSIRLLRTTLMEISSTDIRKRARTGLSTRFLVPEKVRRYMITNKLYMPAANQAKSQTCVQESSLEAAKIISEEIRNNKGEEICVLDMRGISPVADFFIIAQGRSTRHVQGMASRMKKDLSRKKIKCRGMEGEDEGKWILLDFDDIIVHLFYEPVRSFYDLEGLWSEAPRIFPGDEEQPLEGING